MAGEVHGSKAVLKIKDSGNVLQTVDGAESASLDEALDTAETTALGDGSKKYIPGLGDGDLSFDGSKTPTNTTLVRGIKGLVRDFEYYPEGVGTGLEKVTGSLIVTGITRTSPVNDKAKLSAKFKVTGDIVGTTQP